MCERTRIKGPRRKRRIKRERTRKERQWIKRKSGKKRQEDKAEGDDGENEWTKKLENEEANKAGTTHFLRCNSTYQTILHS